MTSPLAHSSSDTARLMTGALSYQVGWQQPLYLPNPAAGASWAHTVDGRYFERALAITFTLVTSAVVANRFAQLYVLDTNGNIVTSVPAAGVIPASTTVNVFLSLGNPTLSNSTSGGAFGFIPDLLLPPGWQWKLNIFNEDAGDQVSATVLLVQQFPNDATSITAGE